MAMCASVLSSDRSRNRELSATGVDMRQIAIRLSAAHEPSLIDRR
jgi:hypothetical protein